MKVLIEITHPAHAYFFYHSIIELRHRGHEVLVAARDKDRTVALLGDMGIDSVTLSKKGRNVFSLLLEMLVRDYRLWKYCRHCNVDILTGWGGTCAAHAGFALGKPVVIWGDTEAAALAHKITYPFCTAFVTPECFKQRFGKKHITYQGCPELAYLHPSKFNPDAQAVRDAGIDPDEKYCLIRLVNWGAHHDVGEHGIRVEDKIRFINSIAEQGRVYISSEDELPEELAKYQINVPVDIHHVLSFADVYVGEGITMAREAAILGVPSICINSTVTGNIKMLEEYGLVRQTTDLSEAFQLAVKYFGSPELKQVYLSLRDKFIREGVDLTNYIVNILEKFGSKKDDSESEF